MRALLIGFAVLDGKQRSWVDNPYRSRYIHLLNLRALFEFFIPALQDYGVALKSNDWAFRTCFYRMFLLFLCCTSKGSSDYKRCMYLFLHILRYWEQHGLPVNSFIATIQCSLRKGENFFFVLSCPLPPSLLHVVLSYSRPEVGGKWFGLGMSCLALKCLA